MLYFPAGNIFFIAFFSIKTIFASFLNKMLSTPMVQMIS